MKVFKFGGASVKDADSVRNVGEIVKEHGKGNLIIVVSAMDKMTNKLEEVQKARFDGENVSDLIQSVEDYHLGIAAELSIDDSEIRDLIEDLKITVNQAPSQDFDEHYDVVVAYGELLSTRIVENYLRSADIHSEWLDVRNIILTDSSHRRAKVDWDQTQHSVEILKKHLDIENPPILVTQGFIGKSSDGKTVTLGREGSDYSAAILAYLSDAEEVVIWKDVDGMRNADPKWFNNTEVLNQISYREAIELSYYGASVIHPKTLKPLQNKSVPLKVKSFIDPDARGTLIHKDIEYDALMPSYIFKPDQVLISFSPRDFSFITEGSLRDIFGALDKLNISINLMQNSALNFSIVVDGDDQKRGLLFEELSEIFKIRYNDSLKLLTIRHYDEKTVNSLTEGYEVLLEQKSRETLRMVLRSED